MMGKATVLMGIRREAAESSSGAVSGAVSWKAMRLRADQRLLPNMVQPLKAVKCPSPSSGPISCRHSQQKLVLGPKQGRSSKGGGRVRAGDLHPVPRLPFHTRRDCSGWRCSGRPGP